MNKRNIIIIAAAIGLIAGILFAAFSKTGSRFLNKSVQEKTVQTTPAAPPAAGHQGHGGGAPPPPSSEASAQEQVAGEEPQTIEIPPEKQQLIGVKVVTAAVKPLKKTIRTVGRVEYDERKVATINTKIEGWIERLHVNYTGRFVKKGEPLAEIYSPELVATQREYLNVLRWAQQGTRGGSETSGTLSKMFTRDAEAMREAAKQRLKLWDITESQIKKIETTGTPIRTLAIYSPVSGYVVQKMALQGMRVMPGEKLFDIADLSTVWVIADIYEYELPLIKTGESAAITLSYFPDKVLHSKIDFIYPVLAGETRTAKVRFVIPNPGGQLKPQMFTNVELHIDIGNKLVIPDDAIINTGTRRIVYVDKGEGYFEPRDITAGISAEGMTEVVRGLKAGEKVAASATFLIDSEARLKGIVK